MTTKESLQEIQKSITYFQESKAALEDKLNAARGKNEEVVFFHVWSLTENIDFYEELDLRRFANGADIDIIEEEMEQELFKIERLELSIDFKEATLKQKRRKFNSLVCISSYFLS